MIRCPARARRATVILATFLAACARDDSRGVGGPAVTLPTPYPRPSFTLTGTDGQPFDFQARTRGKLTFVLFGYTHCPDVCPVHVANIAAAMRVLTFEERARTTLVFITTDPDRDSLPVLRSWLASFDSTFVGLRGPVEDVTRLAASLQVAAAMFGARNPDGSYEVGHGAQVIVWQPDDTARVIYPFGVRQAEWAEAMPRLVGRTPTLIQRITGKS
ncbi:MAG: SCO family protein [Gemmatimonadetes bacterium]|nr:SCO family protein [Gemmatimonadota bacterium]